MIPEGEKYSELVKEVEDKIKRYYSNLPLTYVSREKLDKYLDFNHELTDYQKDIVNSLNWVHINFNEFNDDYKYKIQELKKIWYFKSVVNNIPSNSIIEYFPNKILVDKSNRIYKDNYWYDRLRLLFFKVYVEEKLKEEEFYKYIEGKAKIAQEFDMWEDERDLKIRDLILNKYETSEGLDKVQNYIDFYYHYYNTHYKQQEKSNTHPNASMKNDPKEINRLNILQKEANLSAIILNTDNIVILGENRLKAVLKLYSNYLSSLRRKKKRKQDYVINKRKKYQENEAVVNAKKKKDRDQQIIKLFEEGKSKSAIARSFEPGISRTTVINVLKWHEIRKSYKEGKNVDLISKEFDLDYKYIFNHLLKEGLIDNPYLPIP